MSLEQALLQEIEDSKKLLKLTNEISRKELN
jgi:hypothetical protein